MIVAFDAPAGYSLFLTSTYLLSIMRFYFSLLAIVPVAVTSFQVPTSTTSPRLGTIALNAEPNGSNNQKKKVIVLGGDGFCGWPTSLYLSDQGHDVVIVDNLSRRKIDLDLGCDSLTPIASPEVRLGRHRNIH